MFKGNLRTIRGDNTVQSAVTSLLKRVLPLKEETLIATGAISFLLEQTYFLKEFDVQKVTILASCVQNG